MDWLSSDHVGIPTDMHATIEGLCFLLVHAKELPAGSLELSSVVGYVPDGKDVSRGHCEDPLPETTSED
jgi:hypothetical protein